MLKISIIEYFIIYFFCKEFKFEKHTFNFKIFSLIFLHLYKNIYVTNVLVVIKKISI